MTKPPPAPSDRNPDEVHGSSGALVSVLIPCRNEVDHIDQCLRGLLSQDYDGPIEYIVADGRSSDGTRAKLETWEEKDPRVHVIDNPCCTVPAGLNLGIQAASGEIILRADVHTRYASDYVLRSVEALIDTGADNVGGPWLAEGHNTLQTAIAAAFRSPFSSGGAKSHSPTYEGPVDTVYLGCWKRETLIRAGMFDEELVRNQDDELNLRIIRNGGLVWQTPLIRSVYTPRASLSKLFRQYFQYGFWKVRVIQKHRLPAAWRHLVPALAAFAGLSLGILSPWSETAGTVLLWLAVAYLGLAALAAINASQHRYPISVLLLLPIVFFTFHLGYGLGSLAGLINFSVLKRPPPGSATRLTR